MKIALAIGAVYLLFNIYVTIRINRSFYLSEERRRLHKGLIWIIPLIGPIVLINFWTKKKIKPETMTKEQRDKRKEIFMKAELELTPKNTVDCVALMPTIAMSNT